jgi:hypothetical protein
MRAIQRENDTSEMGRVARKICPLVAFEKPKEAVTRMGIWTNQD